MAIFKESTEGGPTEVSRFYRRNGLQGIDSARVFRGTHAECAAVVASQVVAGSVEVLEWEQDGAISTIVIRSPNAQDGSGQEFFDTWELLGNNSQEDIGKSKRGVALTPDQIGTVKAAIATKEGGSTPSFTGWVADMTNLYNLVIAGHSSFYESQYVLRKNRWLSNAGDLKADLSNIFKTHTTAQVQANENIPAGIRFSVSTVAATLPMVTFSAELAGLFAVGTWLKFPPTVTQIGRANKVQIGVEYWLGNWNKFAYEAAT